MAALVATRFLFLVGDTLTIKKLPKISRAVSFHRSACVLRRFGSTDGPLTLKSLGFRDEDETTTTFEKNNITQTVSTLQILQGQVEEVKSKRVKVKTKAVAFENPVVIDSAPFSAQSFSELGLAPLLIEALNREGFEVPTDVQSAAIPTILKSHDAVIQSYTGSGKTLAYVLPILSEVGPLRSCSPINNKEAKKKADIEAVIIAPSRELGMQIVREIEKLLGLENKNFVQQLVGGANRTRQEEALRKNKPGIVVGTPGRIAEISSAGKLHTHGCRFLVLDEIDQLLSFNFREDMHRIVEHVGKKADSSRAQNSESVTKKRVERQTIMVSATVPFAVTRAARSWGRDPILVQAKKVGPLESVPRPAGPVNLSLGPTSTSSPASDMQQSNAVSDSLPPSLKHYYCLSRLQHKVDTVRRCVHALDAKTVIVFMNHTRQLKDAVFKLQARGLVAEELHGDLGKLTRSTILKKFKKGEIRVLVTNELSARGLDVANCDLVVNVDLPTDSVHYAHRAGRTGRLGRMGSVVTICEESEVFVVRKLQRQLGVPFQSCEFSDGKLVIDEEK